ncbi:hypothetical protein SAMN04515673_102138 [Poseidonocella sedimentorum]|uniref:Methyltransferase type 11 domain-containing protein n=1 Tax=Poseidonocella sedimentorum TaxID=871652 RepID=A0A1I6D4J5_9RHOB|nr:hypothetical protein SAMN04515673_102138 [Poseidonocella sedimentorum]
MTDGAALARNRTRAREGLLQELARDEVEDRLAMVNRRFTAAAVVTGFPEIWRGLAGDAVLCPEAEVLELAPGAHDLVIHALGLHWANDPLGQLIQCRRALKPDGLLLCATLGGRTLQELRAALAEAETRLTGGLSPRVAPMAGIRDLGGLLQRAGFALPVADSVLQTLSYPSPRALMHDLRAMGEGNALHLRPRHTTRRAIFTEAERLYRAQHAGVDGRVPASIEMIVLSGWAPEASQPRPLRPGSATTRLADALGTSETPMPIDPAD